MADLSRDDARRLALRAQGFYDPRPRGEPNRATLKRILDRINLFQIDSVNVLVRSHYLPLFSRAGNYDPGLLRDAAWGAPSKRLLFEYWAHEASLVPLPLRPLLVWRMDLARSGKGMWNRVTEIRKRRAFVASLLRAIEVDGPAPASAFKRVRSTGSWWGWSDVKAALEYLFWSGALTVRARTNGFERVYDVPERVFSQSVMSAPVPPPREAHRALMHLAARALGVATESDLRDYFRLGVADARAALETLIEGGELQAVAVDGWKQRAFVLPGAPIPRHEPAATALLSPFDSLVWKRDRTHRLFDFHYRIEIYTPPHKRTYGYYVLPVLHDGRLVGRLDLKADRKNGTLLVAGRHYESAAGVQKTGAAIDGAIEEMASWLGLGATT